MFRVEPNGRCFCSSFHAYGNETSSFGGGAVVGGNLSADGVQVNELSTVADLTATGQATFSGNVTIGGHLRLPDGSSVAERLASLEVILARLESRNAYLEFELSSLRQCCGGTTAPVPSSTVGGVPAATSAPGTTSSVVRTPAASTSPAATTSIGSSAAGTSAADGVAMTTGVGPTQFGIIDTFECQESGGGAMNTAVIDTVRGFALFAEDNTITKIHLQNDSCAGRSSKPDHGLLKAAAVDTTTGHVYYGTSSHLNVMVKSSTLTVSNLSTTGASFGPGALLIDELNGRLYSFGSGTAFVHRTGSLELARVVSLSYTVSVGTIDVRRAAIYAGSDATGFNDHVVKFTIESGTLLAVSSIVLGGNDERNVRTLLVDPVGDNLYVATTSSAQSRLARVALAGFAYNGSVLLSTLSSGYAVNCAVIDPQRGFAYVGLAGGYVVKVSLVPTNFTVVGMLRLWPSSAGKTLHSGAIDVVSGVAYFGTSDGQIVKIGL